MAKKVEPAAVLRFEAPYDSASPQLTSDAVGLPRLMHRPGASHDMDVTILDTEDARLLRAGVLLAHRKTAGTGDWYLSAPTWAPHLPTEFAEPMGRGDIPKRFARLVRPFVRGAALSPIAMLACRRDEWALRATSGEVAAVVRDEKVQVHRAGAITGQYREITITPEGILSGQQREFLLSAARGIDATVVSSYPTIRQRVGAPATGLTSFPKPRDVGKDASLEEFVSAIFAGHLNDIVRAELDRRALESEDLGALNDRLWVFGRSLRGLAPVLDPAWREDVESTLSALPFSTPADIEQPVLSVIDALVTGARAPRLGDLAHRDAAPVLFDRAQQAAFILAERCRTLTRNSPDDAWQAALRAAQQLEVAAAVAAPLMPKNMGRLLLQLDEVLDDLRLASADTQAGDPELDGVSPAQAYQLGLDMERRRGEGARRRREFIDRWPGQVAEARKYLAKAEKKLGKQLKKQQRKKS